MSQRVPFGVVGGYGNTGRVVVSELAKSCAGEILIGGRNLARAQSLAEEFQGRVSASHLDVMDANSLAGFCSRCCIVVNCAAPVMVLQDRVAQTAFQARSHYVDAASLMIVKDRMLAHAAQIADARLSFVISAGWFPGISEILPAYAYAQARMKMDSIESVTTYFGDTGEWSGNAMQEAAWLIRRLGFSRRGYFHNGKWVRAGISGASRQIDLGGRIGRRRFFLFSNPEFDELGARLNDCTLSAYGCLPGWRTALASSLIALLPLSQTVGGRLLASAFRRDRLPLGGFVVVHARGRSAQGVQTLSVQTIYDEHRDYWINGIVPATVARMIWQNKGIEAGLHFLASAVDPFVFLSELRRGGIDFTEGIASHK